MIFFTADSHFGHENIILYCGRPFNHAQQMEQAMITRYRSIVQPEDICYFVGDFSIKGSQHRGYLEYIVSQLPGTKILILGNHDKFNPFTYIDVGFRSVHTLLEVEEFILHHDPVASIMAPDRIWLCGHTHTLFKTIRNVINVGVDQWDFAPVSIVEIRRLMNELKQGQQKII